MESVKRLNPECGRPRHEPMALLPRTRGRRASLPPLLATLVLSLAACRPEPTPSALQETAPPVPASETALTDTAELDAALLDLAERRVVEVYEQVSPAVVNITTRVVQPSFFYQAIPQEGAGSGFVLDKEGHILTNYHVIEGVQSAQVTFGDETVLPASFVGADPQNDLAVLKVEAPARTLTPVVLGTSSGLQVGQRAIAIGNPFGQFGRTLTTGVVSALDRTLEGPEGVAIGGMIQTDAAINRGNSGGPLLDSAGRVIGVNTAIFSPSGTSSGVGFAIPVDTVRRVLPDLLRLGYYRHPSLGVRYAYPVAPLAEALELPVREGVLLVELTPDSPLAAQGVRGAQREAVLGNRRIFVGGDILTAVEGEAVGSPDDLQAVLEARKVGDPVRVTVVQGGETRTLTVSLVEEGRP